MNMISKQTKIKLAKMLSLVSEVNTDKGLLVADNEIAVGEEVFVYDENGDLIPASDGEYIVDTITYVVAAGKITEIKEQEVEETKEPEVETEEQVTETETAVEDEKVEIEELQNQIETLNATVAERDSQIEIMGKRIADLEAQNKELEDKVADYKAKEGQSVEEPISDNEDKFNKEQPISGMEKGKQNAMRILAQKQD